ncbi:MAG TPA: Y-family DNA polymerase [Cycloclasticus sp.]|jgi:DNA polymerase V|nr:Y-family DNA polymerase [Cycloclasticus sp.]HIL92867.1 Y-family DNA polymerase [Cycloclasticus sp.]
MPANIALVDCNNFYVSCERLFRPDLINKPVAVLSNNDGCIVARSQEVKDLGIKMAVPVHQVKELIQQHDIQLFSSNYPLYADLSARIMHSLSAFSPTIDVYSIDEAFVDLDRANLEPTKLGHDIKDSLSQWVGIPVGVGIGPTKTLAKLANYAAKKWPKTGGVVDISDAVKRKKIMQITAVNEIWGVGRRLTERLNALGIESIWDLQSQSIGSIRKHFNITLAQTVQELQGTPVMPFAEPTKPKQQIICSRSFRDKLTSEQDLAQTLSVFCLRAAEKLRAQQGLARKVSVFIRTSPFDNSESYSKSVHYKLKSATSDSRDLLKITKQLLASIYKEGYQYQQAGVVLGDITSSKASTAIQHDLFAPSADERSEKLMVTLDQINQRFDKQLTLAAVGNKKLWQSVPINRSNQYTTDWKGLARVKV